MLASINETFDRHDLYAILIGLYVYFALVLGVGKLGAYLRRHDIVEGILLALKWMGVVFRYGFLSVFVLGILPLLIGVLFELTIMIPFRNPIQESPRFFLERDWVFGVIFLKVWFQLLMTGILGENDVKAAVQQILNDGPEHINVVETMRRAVLPVLHQLICLLCIPYALSWGAIPLLMRWTRASDMLKLVLESDVAGRPLTDADFELNVLSICQIGFRCGFLIVLGLAVGDLGATMVWKWYVSMKQSMFEERYLIGKRLHNFGEKPASEPIVLAEEKHGRPDDPGTDSDAKKHDIKELLGEGTQLAAMDEALVEEKHPLL